MTHQSENRRQELRETAEWSIRFLHLGTFHHEMLHGRLLDVSVSGVQVSLNHVIEQGDRLVLEAYQSENMCLIVVGTVAWSKPCGDGGYNIGCRLSKPLSECHQEILRLAMRSPDLDTQLQAASEPNRS